MLMLLFYSRNYIYYKIMLARYHNDLKQRNLRLAR
nr:MAG TPA: hypothetical protein [Caudoviricetes sp.]